MSNARNLSQGDTRFVNTSGDTMTGDLSVTGGNVGIGTSPTTPLDVTKANGGNFVATFQNTSSSTPYGVFIKDAPSGANGYPLLQVTNSAGSAHYFRVDSGTGRVTMPYQPAFQAFAMSASNNGGDLDFTHTLINRGNHFSVANNRFTAPVTGVYHLHFHGFVDTGNTATGAVYITKNGSTSIQGYEVRNYTSDITSSAYGPPISVTATIELATNDYVSVQSALGLHANAGNYFGGYLIG